MPALYFTPKITVLKIITEQTEPQQVPGRVRLATGQLLLTAPLATEPTRSWDSSAAKCAQAPGSCASTNIPSFYLSGLLSPATK